MKKNLVSVVMPTFNCEDIVGDALESVKKQKYKHIEIIVVDSFSTDKTAKIAKKYAKIYSYGKDPKQKNIFAVPYQVNFGMSKARGEYVYIVDSDMRLLPDTISECVALIKAKKADAVVVPERSYGEGFWAKCKELERSCFNIKTISYSTAARFLRKKIWNSLGGLDDTLGGSYDGDLQLRLNKGKYKTVKISKSILHYEGKLTLKKQIRKKFAYGKNILDYMKKHKSDTSYIFKEYSFIKPDFIENFNLLANDPIHAVGMVFMKLVEYTAGLSGLIYELITNEKVKIISNNNKKHLT